MKKFINSVAIALLTLTTQIMAQDQNDSRTIIFVNDIDENHTLIIQNGAKSDVNVFFQRFDPKLVKDLNKNFFTAVVQDNRTGKAKIVCFYDGIASKIENPPIKNRGMDIKVTFKKGLLWGYKYSVDYFGISNPMIEEKKSLTGTEILSKRLGIPQNKINNPDEKTARHIFGFSEKEKVNNDDLQHRYNEMEYALKATRQELESAKGKLVETKRINQINEILAFLELLIKSNNLLYAKAAVR